MRSRQSADDRHQLVTSRSQQTSANAMRTGLVAHPSDTPGAIDIRSHDGRIGVSENNRRSCTALHALSCLKKFQTR
jgi:hypothetical protein